MTTDHNEEMERKYEGKVSDAIIFSFNAHAGQYRKGEPYQYIIHPLRVSEFLLKNFSHKKNIETLRVAAILHDVIEDTWADENKVRTEFGDKIATLVLELTVPEQKDRKDKHIAHLHSFQNASDDAKLIKLADLFDNVAVSMRRADQWINYLQESKELLESLTLKEKDSVFEKIKEELAIIIDNKIKSAKESEK